MNSLNKEFDKKVYNDIKNIKKLAHVDYIGDDTIFDIKASDKLGVRLIASIDYDVLCTMGDLDISIYQDGTFGIGKDDVPFGINDLSSLQNVVRYFYGTPFNINMERIGKLDFVRYIISIPEVKVDNFSRLKLYIELMSSSLNAINEHCYCNS